MATVAKEGFWSDELVLDSFDRSDQQDLELTQKAMASQLEFRKGVREATRGFVKAHRASLPKKGAGSKRKVRLPDLDQTTREEAMLLLPPAMPWSWRVYRDPRNARWQAHHRVHGTCSRSWGLYGPGPALARVLAHVWAIEVEVGSVDACPYAVLLLLATDE